MRLSSIILIIIIFIISCDIFDNNASQSSVKKLYVTMQSTDQVAVFDTPALNLLKIVEINFTGDNVIDTPQFIVLDEENGYWFVTTIESGWVAQYSLETDELIDTLHVGNFPALMAINSDNKKLYVSRMMMKDAEYIINEIDYNDGALSNRDFPLGSPVLHGITMDLSKEYVFTVSNTADWIYRININANDNLLSASMDAANPDPQYPNKKFQPIQCIAINDSLIAITCSAIMGQVNGQIQLWNGNDLSWVSTYELTSDSRPWHLIKSPIKDEIFVTLSGTNGNGGVACFTYTENDAGQINFSQKWFTSTSEYNILHGITIDSNGEYIYVSGRGDHMLYKFDAEMGTELEFTPLGGTGELISPAGLAIMQNACINCE